MVTPNLGSASRAPGVWPPVLLPGLSQLAVSTQDLTGAWSPQVPKLSSRQPSPERPSPTQPGGRALSPAAGGGLSPGCHS